MYDANLGITISPELEAEIVREAQRHVANVIGMAYELIPESVRKRIEQEYIEKRIGEVKLAAAGVVPKIAPAAIAIGGGLLLYFLLGRK